jgi:hypothetical protein
MIYSFSVIFCVSRRNGNDERETQRLDLVTLFIQDFILIIIYRTKSTVADAKRSPQLLANTELARRSLESSTTTLKRLLGAQYSAN